MAEISITLNGEVRQVEADSSVHSLIDQFSLPKQRVAIELNREVVRRTDWKSKVVCEGDRLEVVHFVGGG